MQHTVGSSLGRRFSPFLKSTWPDVLLFLSAIVFLFVLPVVSNCPLWVFKLFMSLVLLFSVLSLENSSSYLIWSGFAAMMMYWFSVLGQHPVLHSLLRSLTLVFVFWVLLSLMYKFIRQKNIGVNSLLEAVNGYLLLGIVFTGMVILLNEFFPGSYHSPSGSMQQYDLVYYTIITLTTTGYGDILPLTPGSKNLAMIIALCGQLYVTFVVGVLVGKYTQRFTREE